VPKIEEVDDEKEKRKSTKKRKEVSRESWYFNENKFFSMPKSVNLTYEVHAFLYKSLSNDCDELLVMVEFRQGRRVDSEDRL